MLNYRLAHLSLDKGIIFSFFLGADRAVTQVPRSHIFVYFFGQISQSGHTTDLLRHVLIQSAAATILSLVLLRHTGHSPAAGWGKCLVPKQRQGQEGMTKLWWRYNIVIMFVTIPWDRAFDKVIPFYKGLIWVTIVSRRKECCDETNNTIRINNNSSSHCGRFWQVQ